MAPLTMLIAYLGLMLPFAPSELVPIQVQFVYHPIYSGITDAPDSPENRTRALSISCQKGLWEGVSCPDIPGPVMVIDNTLLPDGYLGNILTHEAWRIVHRSWSPEAYTFACQHYPVPDCGRWGN